MQAILPAHHLMASNDVNAERRRAAEVHLKKRVSENFGTADPANVGQDML